MFLSAEGFRELFHSGVARPTLPSFRQRFRGVDVLIVDDVDFLDGKRVIQESFCTRSDSSNRTTARSS